ncbi:MAG: HAD family hydrolase, partial [Chthoniobacterales bacterium]|nr:HAD family hydrolase [Chthoniobacterales bacterium]
QWITGEAEPRGFSLGGVVPGGAKNLGADEVSLVAMEGWSGSRLERLMRVGGGEGWRNVVLQRIMRGYLRVVILVGVCGFVGWLLSGGGWLKAMQVMISVWVVSCPCAIGVALPLLEDVAATVMRRFGVFVREKELWARLRKVKVILMDKTGTVTLERLGLKNPEAVDGLSQRAREVLLGMTMVSLHPVARCLREELMARGVEGMESVRVREVIGCGIEWARQEGTWRLGKAEWALWDVSHKGQREGTIFSLDGVEVAEFEFEEEVRPDASRQIQELERDGYEVWLLSGDRVEKVKRIGKELGVREERALGGLEPEEKAKLVEGRWGGCSLMLGDGANDSLAFDAALCRGTPAVDTGLLEKKADFYLLGSGLQGLGKLFRMARRHGHTGRALFGFTVLYNFAVVCVSLCGWMNPLVAAIVMPASSLVSIGIVYIGLRIPSDWEEEGDVRSWSKEGNLSKARIFFETIKETKGEKYDERRS